MEYLDGECVAKEPVNQVLKEAVLKMLISITQ